MTAAGGGLLGGWTYQPTTTNYTRDLGEFAIYPQQLTDQQIREHYYADH